MGGELPTHNHSNKLLKIKAMCYTGALDPFSFIVFGPFLKYILFICSMMNRMNFLIGLQLYVDTLEPV